MTLAPGSRLGPYEILAPLGAGGMGEVFRARDTKLGREVALKILPPAVSGDAERLARFEREAQLLAALNHPHIAAIYGVEDSTTTKALVLELVEGPTLQDRIDQGALALDEAIPIARQIADALEAAHEKGIVHRDLKPANVKLTAQGEVKVLDFGLAKALDAGAASQSPSASPTLQNSPTLTGAATQLGVILGTAAYMSPEQARGRAADRRADIWALGVVLYEMLTGRRLFAGETVSDTLAFVLTRDVDWTALPPGAPPSLRRLLQRMLERDPARRLRSAGDAALELEAARSEPAAPASAPTRRSPRERVAWGLVAALAGLAAWAFVGRDGRPRQAPRSAHLEIRFANPERASAQRPPVISPNGEWLLIGPVDGMGGGALRLRRVDSFDAETLPGTDGAAFPFWSPDSRSIGFFAGGALRRFDVATRTAQVICNCAPWARGASWGKDGTILFAPEPNAGIHRIAAKGGADQVVTVVDPGLIDASHRYPTWLPDGEHFLFTLWSNNDGVLAKHGGIYVGSVSGKQAVRRLLEDASAATFAAPDRLLLVRGGKLTAVPFDAGRLEVGEDALTVDQSVTVDPNMGAVAVSASARGDLAWSIGTGEGEVQIELMDPFGREIRALGQPGTFDGLALSPDGSRFAAERTEGTSPSQIWVGEIARGTLVPLTHTLNDSYDAVWSPDGKRIAFASRGSGNEDIYVQSAEGSGTAELVHRAEDHDTEVDSWSADGRYLFFAAFPKASGGAKTQIWAHDFTTGKSAPVLAEDFAVSAARLSPDGRWLAYTSMESGTPQIFLRPFPALDRKFLVSTQGGVEAAWGRDSRVLWYFAPSPQGRRILAVTLRPQADDPKPELPREVVTLPPSITSAAVDPDLRHLLVARQSYDETNGVRVILDWRSSLGPAR